MKELRKVLEGKALSEDEAYRLMQAVMAGALTPAQTAGMLVGLKVRGEREEEIAGFARAMREAATPVPLDGLEVLDVVGTGGDGKGTLNISTATAFVVAGAGQPVAKHGNRNLSSKSGAADALGQMGVNVMVGPQVVEKALEEAGIGFMMAPMHHPAIAHVMPTRAELGTRTIFNILGPLTNPAGVKRQLTGAFAREMIRPMAETLAALGSERAWLVHGSDGTDELSIAGVSWVAALEDGAIREFELHPEEAGLPTHPFEAILGGSPEENGRAFRALLGGAPGAYRDAVLLNAAAALVVAGKVKTLPEGTEMASESIDSGAAKRAIEALARVTSAA